MNNCSIPSMHAERQITNLSVKHSFTLYPSLSPYWQTESQTEKRIPATATSSPRAPSELPESFQRAFSSWANYSNLELLVKTLICCLLLCCNYFHWQFSLFDLQLVLPCVLAFLQVLKSFSHVLYWHVQLDMQPLCLHCWAIWCLFGLRFTFELSLLLLQFCQSWNY